MTDNGWRTLGKRRRAETLAGFLGVYGKQDNLTPAQQRLLAEVGEPAPPVARAKPAQTESKEMQILANWVSRAWWAPGWLRVEHRAPQRSEAWRNWREGVTPGLPDCLLVVPPVDGRERVLAALELKAPGRRPKRANAKGGVSEAQRRCLTLLEACGFKTYVGYGAEDAWLWLKVVAGAEPPGGWPL